MGLFKAIGSVARKVAGFAVNHKEGIGIASTVASTFRPNSSENLDETDLAEFQEAMAELETCLQDLQTANTNLANELNTCNQKVQSLEKQFTALKASEAVYRQKADRRFLIACICGGVGIALALLLAIVL